MKIFIAGASGHVETKLTSDLLYRWIGRHGLATDGCLRGGETDAGGR
ncbi:hypothetical protein C5L18_001192 [Lactobacillus amylolyticus]|uniref:Uncharacterized protein n=1 Tax=Lactobacillus amylolyticus DSM 11664 TaxID=585524 RepID=D4YVM4_9LACO|nr:hypothetical protein HMPREF0493_1585 [Lactobacillus amylolyticus DSM 11664]TDG62779.1 hypothetical protein C5L18_001192 [Lactobacillus amylolyticus]